MREKGRDWHTGTARTHFTHFPEVESQATTKPTFLLPFRMWSSGRCVFQISKAFYRTRRHRPRNPQSRWRTLVGEITPLRHARRIETVHLGEQFPRKVDSSLLEVVTERPVAEHLKEGVVVDVLADIVQIIVLASSTNALLRVAGSFQLRRRTGGVDLGVRGDCECNLSQEDGLVLVHSGVRKEKRRIVEGNNGGGFDKDVSVVLKELDKGATHLGRRPAKFGHESV